MCSSSWLPVFTIDHNIVFGKINGDAKTFPANVTRNWIEYIWSDLRENEDFDVYSADKIRWFFRLTSSQIWRFPAETCSGGKLSQLPWPLIWLVLTKKKNNRKVDDWKMYKKLQKLNGCQQKQVMKIFLLKLDEWRKKNRKSYWP